MTGNRAKVAVILARFMGREQAGSGIGPRIGPIWPDSTLALQIASGAH